MKRLLFTMSCVFFAVLSAQFGQAADAVYIGNAGTAYWTNSAFWANGYIPQAGDTATFATNGNVQIYTTPEQPFSLASIFVNTDNSSRTIAFAGTTTNTLTYPALIVVSNGYLSIREGVLNGSNGLTFTGSGNLELQCTNLFTGPVTAAGGRLLPRFDESFGPAPAALTPAAIVLDGGLLGNADLTLALAPTRGVTVTAAGGHFFGRNVGNSFVVPSPITGTGNVSIVRQSGSVNFSNPANDYSGDTVFGSVYYTSNLSTTDGASLVFGANEVIPDASRLVFVNGHNGTIDLAGHVETVAGIVATNGAFALKDTVGGGVLHTPNAEDLPLNGTIGAKTTLDLTSGTVRFADAKHPAAAPSAGTLSLSGGTLVFSDPVRLGGITLALNGGSLALETHAPGLAEYTSPSGLNTNAADFTFSGVYATPRQACDLPGLLAFGNNTQYLYEGEWHIPADATYSFGKGFDDGACLIIDGQTLIYNNIASAIVVVKDVFLTAGWHTIRLYVGNGSGSCGPRTANGFTSAILYDPANGDITNGLGQVERAYPFADPGDGSVLRTVVGRLDPAASTVHRAPRLEINQSTMLDRSAAPTQALVWANDIVSTPGTTLTVTGGSEPFTVGSSTRPAIVDADIADVHGVRFQNKVWLKTLPTTVFYGADADLAVGVPGILGTGPQTLANYSLRIPSADALGNSATAPVTVPNGRSLTFDSTTESGSTLIDNPTRAFTASNAVTLSGGTLVFDGPGTVTLDAPVNGSGALVKLGPGTAILAQPSGFTGTVTLAAGTLTVLDDTALGVADNSIALATGTALDLSALSSFPHALSFASDSSVLFPATPLTLSGSLSGSLRKTGAASVTLAGSAPNPNFDLYVAEGVVTLANTPGPALRHVLGVDTNASLVLSGTKQISGEIALTGGTLDLAGNALAVDSFRAYAPSVVTNSATGTATLTVGTNNTAGLLIGAVAPNVALVKTGASGFTLAAVPGTSAPASIDLQSGTLVLGRTPQYVRFTILKTRTVGRAPRIGEIMLTRGGKPIPYRLDASASASSFNSNTWNVVASQAIDGSSVSFWLAGKTTSGENITIDLKEPTPFDGYRLYSGTNVSTSVTSGNDPVSWIVELSSDGNHWLTADTVTDALLYSTSYIGLCGVLIYERTLDPTTWPSVPFAATTPVSVASGATLRAAAPDFGLNSLTGAGTFDFLRGASATLGDLSAFSGTFTGAGNIQISSDTPLNIPYSAIPAASTVRGVWGNSPVYFPPDFPTVRAAATPASIVVGASGMDGSFAGCVLDGATSIGLRKIGTGKTTLIDVGSSYTGDTAIEQGTLTVNAGAYKFRYIKFNPTAAQNDGTDSSGFELAYAEFRLMLNGQPVAWPSGSVANPGYVKGSKNHADDVPANAINGNLNDRWLQQPFQPLIVDTQSGVIFDGYSVYESNQNSADYGRCPKTWTVEGSDDGSGWTVIDAQTGFPTPAQDAPATGRPGILIGTFSFRASPRAWLPPHYRVETPVTNQFISAVTAEKFCFQIMNVRNETNTTDNGATAWQFAEITLLRNGQIVPWPEGTTAWTPSPAFVGSPQKLVDNDRVATAANRMYSSVLLNHIVVNAHTNLEFDAYQWTTSHDIAYRDPTSWRFFVMPTNGAAESFTCVDEQFRYATPNVRSATVGPFPLRLAAGLNAVDAIPDTSRLHVATGATFELGANALETVGPLSGSGTVSIATNAVLTVNAFENAVFSGTLVGPGSLALAGTNAQFFAGSGTLPGNFAIDFRGGKFGGTLHVSGALTVTGPVAYALPATLPATVTLFTFGSIDTASDAALTAGVTSVTPPIGMVAKVTVTSSTAVLSVTSPGSLIILR